MKNREEANLLLELASKELRALSGMLDPSVFADEIFGFHAQQAAEKALKAWLAWLGVEYPRTHDLSLLLNLLDNRGADTESFWSLIDYNPYAVQFRYEAFEYVGEPLDRQKAIQQATSLIDYVRRTCCNDEGV